jgi:hypothetical protein
MLAVPAVAADADHDVVDRRTLQRLADARVAGQLAGLCQQAAPSSTERPGRSP